MAVTGLIHHFGSFLLFAATVLIIITNITAPVVHNISLLRVDLGNSTGQFRSSITFGTYGYCVLDTVGADGQKADICTPSQIGYDPAQLVSEATSVDYNRSAGDTARALTKVMVLHPIAAGVAFVAFLLSLGAGMFGSLLASLVALLAFFVTLVPLVTNFVMFGIIRVGVNESSSNRDNAEAEFGAGLWTLLVAAVCLLLGTVILFITCCSARMHRRRDRRTTKAVDGYEAPRRRRWF